jgi:hypothetical protein
MATPDVRAGGIGRTMDASGGGEPMERPLWPSSIAGRVAQAACWSRRDLLSRSSSWLRPLPRALRPDLLHAATALAEAGRPLDAWKGVEVSPSLRFLGASLQRELTEGSGVVFVTGVAPDGAEVSDQALKWAYLLIGAEVGLPIGPHGSLLEISGRCYGRKSREVSKASPETRFHTDSGGGQVPDVVGMLCLVPARTGGECQIASATLAHELLKARCRDLLGELYQPFLRDDDTPAASRHALLSSARPVFTTSASGRTLLFNYMRHRIEAAHQRAEVPLTPSQVSGLDRLDEALNEPVAHVQLQMKRGEILLVNNRHVAHNRRSFVDHVDPARRRRMVRMWLSLAGDAA